MFYIVTTSRYCKNLIGRCSRRESTVILEKRTLAEQVREYILRLIKSTRLSAGMEVPSEMQVIRDLGVSRGVVREAFRSLASLGVLQIGSGKRPRIQAFNPEAMRIIFDCALATEQVEVRHILEMRRALEIGCVALAARHGTEENFQKIRQHMEGIRTDIGDHDRFLEHDIAFHVALAEATENPMYSLMLKALRAPLEQSIHAGLSDERMKNRGKNIVELHQEIVEAVCARDENRATEAMARHFDTAVSDILQTGKKSTLS